MGGSVPALSSAPPHGLPFSEDPAGPWQWPGQSVGRAEVWAEPDKDGRSPVAFPGHQRIGCVCGAGMSNLAEGMEGEVGKFPLIRTQSPKTNFRESRGATEGQKGDRVHQAP